jgi:hypothetical protein
VSAPVQGPELDRLFLEAVAEDSSNYSAIAKRLGVSRQTVTRMAHRLGVHHPRKDRVVSPWDEFFEKIDSPLKAYLLGLISTDGSVRTSHVAVVLSSKDASFCKDVAAALGVPTTSYPVGTSKAGVVLYATAFRFGSRRMCESLRRLGLTRRKTFDIDGSVVAALPSSLFSHFVRGCFDGDGHVTPTHHDPGISLCSASVSFLTSFTERLSVLCEIKRPALTHHRIWNVAWHARIDLRRLYDFLYKDGALCLSRKRDRLVTHVLRLENDRACRVKSAERKLLLNSKRLLAGIAAGMSGCEIDRKHDWHPGKARMLAKRLNVCWPNGRWDKFIGTDYELSKHKDKDTTDL